MDDQDEEVIVLSSEAKSHADIDDEPPIILRPSCCSTSASGSDDDVIVLKPATPEPQADFCSVELKIGKVAQAVFPVLFAEGHITHVDVSWLMSDAAVKFFKTSGNQVLRETTNPDVDSRDAKGIRRFYSKFILSFDGRQYILTSQWFKNGLDNLLTWFDERGISRERACEICGCSQVADHANETGSIFDSEPQIDEEEVKVSKRDTRHVPEACPSRFCIASAEYRNSEVEPSEEVASAVLAPIADVPDDGIQVPVAVIYGSLTGATERVAQQIAERIGVEAFNVARATADTFNARLLILGTSTCAGEIQDDWKSAGLTLLDEIDMRGKKVALFGTGDSVCFDSTFGVGMAVLARKVLERGATLVGTVSSLEYGEMPTAGILCDDDSASTWGLLLDLENSPDEADMRIASWMSSLFEIADSY